VDLRKLKKLIDLVQESGIAELEITEGEEKVRIARGGAVSVTPLAGGAPSVAAVPAGATGAAVLATSAPAAAEAAPEGHVVKSPMVGTFYRSASPEADAFAEVGSRISKGKILCIIESMKLMNEIESDVEGEVVAVYPRNGQPVEYGEKLFAIRLAA